MATLAQLAHFIATAGGKLLQRGEYADDHAVNGPRNGDEAGTGQFTFFNAKAGDAVYGKIAGCGAALIIIEDTLDANRLVLPRLSMVFSSPDAKKAMMECAREFYVQAPRAFIHPNASIDLSATIGENALIHSGAVISSHVVIGDNCIIEPNVYIHSHSVIGNNVHIKANAVIGGNGFGYVKSTNGTYEHVPHFGRVCIEDDVHIGSNTCIDRGSLSDTIIKKGVKIDNLVHIAHNVEIGENTLVIACSMVAGSVKIGENAWIAPAASIRNGITIGNDTVVGMGSLVLKSVADGVTVAGVPAKEIEKK
jgi:UDP-3-O-[3-hydroxymyristoyl] glucosamine N-acyltransferase